MVCTFCSVSPAFGSSFTYAKRTDHVIFDAESARNEKALRMLAVAVFVPRKNISSQPSTWRIHRSEIKGETAKRAEDIRGGGCAVARAGAVTIYERNKKAGNKKPPEGGW
jgi:hypothetical protein